MNDVLRLHYSQTVTEEELAREAAVPHPPLRTREELAYYRMFAAVPGVDAQKNVGRSSKA
jgi:asparagine synthase (glutamine-hydrolysing)